MTRGLNRSKSMRQAYAEKCRKEGRYDSLHGKGPPKPRKPLKKQSAARAREMRLYYEERVQFLLRPENLLCAVCRLLGEDPMAAVEVHHARGRVNKLLRDQRFWVGTCRAHRETPHLRPAWAREMGILSSATEFNTYPRE